MEFTGERLVPGQVDEDLWAEHFSRYQFAAPLVSGRRVLDLGSGAGYGARHLARSAQQVVGVDLSAEAVAFARQEYPADNVRYVQASAASLPFPDDAFDVVVAFEVIEHVREQEAVLAEVHRVLAPGGVLVVSTPNRVYYSDERGEHNAFHVREFELDEFVRFLRTAFPHVALHLQNHVPAVVIDAAEGMTAERPPFRAAGARSEDRAEALRAAHYGVAVCSDAPVSVPPLVYFSAGTGNVLRTRERHIQMLHEDVAAARRAFTDLQTDWSKRGEWVQQLDQELAQERDALRVTRAELEAQVGRAALLDARVAELEQEAARLRSAILPPALRTALRRSLPAMAATLAAPLAGALGVSAGAVELMSRLRPPTAPPEDDEPIRPAVATLLILNYNGADLLEKNLPHLQRAIAHTGQPHQLLVVDNGSTDSSLALLRERFPTVDTVALPRNYFFSGGNDRGVPHAKHDIVVLLNTDMRVEPDFLEPLLRPFEADPSVFAVASQILMAPGKRREETGFTRGRFVRGQLDLRHDPVPEIAAGQTIPILWGGGGACAFDKRKFLALGGLDVLYDPFYCEDLDLSLRAWMRGWKVLFAPDSKVWHDHRTTSRRVFGEDFVNETFRRNTLLLLWKNLQPAQLAEHLMTLPFIAAAQARAYGLSALRSLAKAAWMAPRALARRREPPGGGPSLASVLEHTELGLDPAGRVDPRRGVDGRPLKVTMVVPYHLVPIEHGGASRMYNIARELSRRGNEVSIVGFVDTDEQLDNGKALREFCREVRLLRRGPPEPGRRPLDPGDVREFDQLALRQELADHLRRCDPDVLQVEYTQMAPYGRLAAGRLACLTEHDVSFVSRYRQARSQRGRAAWRAYGEYLTTFRYELRALRDYDVVFTVTPHDAELLRAYVGRDVVVSDRAPIGVDVGSFGEIVRAPAEVPTLLFVGYFAHHPNVDAVEYFAADILPALHRELPDLRVIIAGAQPPPSIRRLAEDPRIEVPGFVPDLAALYARASAFVAPIRLGAGVRVKLFEAFAARIPVVSSHLGAEGIAVTHDRDVLLADAPADFARQVLRLFRDPGLGHRLAANARALVEQRYAWAAIAANLEQEYRAALDRKARRTA